VRSGAGALLGVIASSLVAGRASLRRMGVVTDFAVPEVKAEARKIDRSKAIRMESKT
jgi:hypothetical protein